MQHEKSQAHLLFRAGQSKTPARRQQEEVRSKSAQNNRDQGRPEAAVPGGYQHGEDEGRERDLLAQHRVEKQPDRDGDGYADDGTQ